MKVSIKTYVGMARSYTYDVEPTTTIKQLKQNLCNTLSCRDDLPILCLIRDGEELEQDKKTLADYGVADGCRLEANFLGETYRGDIGFVGSRFLDVTNSKGLKRVAWSTSAPRWRRTIRGLCLEGICSNSSCKAFNQYVIIRIGYETFNILEDPDETTTTCPICEKFVDPLTVSFNNCWWRFEGIKQPEKGSGQAPQRISSPWYQVDDAYHYFDEASSGSIVWKKLVIQAVKDKPN